MAGEDARARLAWRALQDAFADDERWQALLAQLSLAPDLGERALRDRLTELIAGGETPTTLATYVSGGSVDRLVNIARAHTVNIGVPPAPRTPFQLPPDIADFTGRDELVADLSARLASDRRGAPAVLLLHGMAGAGKSALAVHVAHAAA
jgi:hypothetical protein